MFLPFSVQGGIGVFFFFISSSDIHWVFIPPPLAWLHLDDLSSHYYIITVLLLLHYYYYYYIIIIMLLFNHKGSDASLSSFWLKFISFFSFY
eukprot:m.73322 g.73322  ORF g.73322 m.73322 type:complete len:92 (+) comp8417_c0_seq1:174-449(+)